ncbi:hypothetical protein Tco_0025613 [Tanacetum coccineum]
MTKDRILKDYWKESFRDEEDDSEDLEDPDECRDEKANTILGAVINKLHKEWFNGTSKDEDDLDGIINYLEPTSYYKFIDLDNEAYNERRWEIYTKIKVLGIEDFPRTMDNVTTIRGGLMEEIGSNSKETEFEVTLTSNYVVILLLIAAITA